MNLGIPDSSTIAVIAFYAAFVFGLIAALRKEAPKLDGRVVYVLAISFSIGVAFLLAPDVHAYRAWVWFGVQIGGGAVALASGINYAAGKMTTGSSVTVNQAIAAATEAAPGAIVAAVAKDVLGEKRKAEPVTPTKPAA